jgi:hypothetical protein
MPHEEIGAANGYNVKAPCPFYMKPGRMKRF